MNVERMSSMGNIQNTCKNSQSIILINNYFSMDQIYNMVYDQGKNMPNHMLSHEKTDAFYSGGKALKALDSSVFR